MSEYFKNASRILHLSVIALALTSQLLSPQAGRASPAQPAVELPASQVSAPLAQTIYVNSAVIGGALDGTSWTDAYTDLQDALRTAVTGDQIWVAAGVYTPTQQIAPPDPRSATFALVDGVEIYGGFDGSENLLEDRDVQEHRTILSGDFNVDDNGFSNNSENAYHVVTGGGVTSSAILDGFTIQGGNANGTGTFASGAAIYNASSSPRLANLLITYNTAFASGGGVYNAASNPVLVNVTFDHNTTVGHGGGMYNYASSPRLYSVGFYGNAAQHGGGLYNNASLPWLVSCLFSGNSASRGGGLYNAAASSANLINTTFSANTALPGEGSGIYNTNSNPQLKNSIVWGNIGAQITNNSGSFDLRQSIIQGGCPGGAGVSCIGILPVDTDPLFLDSNGMDNVPGTPDDNLHLSFASPAIDRGHNVNVPADIGDSDEDGDTAEKVPYDLDLHPRFIEILFVPNLGEGTPPIVDLGANEARIVYVKAGSSGTNGTSWSDAYPSLAVALDEALLGDELWVAQGVYTPTLRSEPLASRSAHFGIKQGVSIFGGFEGSEVVRSQRDPIAHPTVLSGDLSGNDLGFANNSENSYHVVKIQAADSLTRLDGFTIRGGNAVHPDDQSSYNKGGGMLVENASPSLSNLRFTENNAIQGGGVYNLLSSPLFVNCAWIGNQGRFGGGMRNLQSNPQMVNVLFNGNQAEASGGGLYNSSSSPTIVNATFTHNAADTIGYPSDDGDAVLSDQLLGDVISHPVFKNTILWDNDNAPFSLDTGNQADFEYGLVEGGCPSGATCTNLLAADPLFRDPDGADGIPGTTDDDLALRLLSPAANAGNNNAVPADTLDLNGNQNILEKIPYDLVFNPRFLGVSEPFPVDLGAYEIYPAYVFLPVVLK